MAEKNEVTGLTINDGVKFGFGFFLVNLAGFAAIGVVAWLIILAARYFGLTF